MGNFLKSAWKWVKELFSTTNKYVQELCEVAIKVVNVVKAIKDDATVNTAIKAIVSLTATKVDDVTYEVVKSWLDENRDKVADALNIANSISGITDENERLVAILNTIQAMGINDRTTAWTALASMVVENLSDGEYSWEDITETVKYVYDNKESF